MKAKNTLQPGMRTFLIIWAGQFVSLVGSGLTSFALGVYIFQQTGDTAPVLLIWLFFTLPSVILSPVAGVLVDRWDRRRVMIASDTAAAMGTLFVAALLIAGRLEIWHIYLSTAVASAAGAFQGPAYGASLALLVDKEQLGRANGLYELAQAASGIAAPVIAGLLLGIIGLGGIILLDVGSFLFAVITLLLVHIPRPEVSADGLAARGTIWQEVRGGWRFVATRRGLLGLMALAAAINVVGGLAEVLVTPLVLSFSDEAALGVVQGLGGVGFLIGGLVISAWGGPKRRIRGVLIFELIAATMTIALGLRASVVMIALAFFALHFTYPILTTCHQTIWQTKVPTDMQGRVFALRRAISWLPVPLALLLAGPIVDNIFEPLMATDGAFAGSIGQWIGVGDGRGIALMIILCGALNVIAVVTAYLYPRVRYLERELPDRVESPVQVKA